LKRGSGAESRLVNLYVTDVIRKPEMESGGTGERRELSGKGVQWRSEAGGEEERDTISNKSSKRSSEVKWRS